MVGFSLLSESELSWNGRLGGWQRDVGPMALGNFGMMGRLWFLALVVVTQLLSVVKCHTVHQMQVNTSACQLQIHAKEIEMGNKGWANKTQALQALQSQLRPLPIYCRAQVPAPVLQAPRCTAGSGNIYSLPDFRVSPGPEWLL